MSYRTPVSVHKTDISPTIVTPTDPTPPKIEDPAKTCPIHKKPHPLYKCRAFRERTLEERKAFLKQSGICFHCCSSTSHLAKNCATNVRCTECDDDRHHSVLHPGPAPWSIKTLKPTHEHGGEDESVGQNVAVTSKCTEVCGGDTTGRSCSKICLVKVFPTGQPDKAVKLYAILDEQSNRSLVRSEFFELFNVKGGRSPYSLRTCAGIAEKSGTSAHGFQIQSLDEEVTLTLPTLIECNQIPNDRSEIPTPEVSQNKFQLYIPRLP